MKTVTKSEKETFTLARDFAATLVGGEVLALTGELGAGKTVFVKGLAAGLGITSEVTSPTFALMNVYEGRLRLCHVDAYRLSSAREAAEAGIVENLGEEGTVCCIEWAENIAGAIFDGAVKINIKYLAGEEREIEIEQ